MIVCWTGCYGMVHIYCTLDHFSLPWFCLTAFAVLGFTFSIAVGCVKVATLLHTRLLNSILRAPMSFFDTTPLGRILNRFSQDMTVVDSQIRFTLMATVRGTSAIVVTIVAISYTSYFFLVIVVPIGIIYYYLQVVV